MHTITYSSSRERCTTTDKLERSNDVWKYITSICKEFRTIHQIPQNKLNKATIINGFSWKNIKSTKEITDFLDYFKEKFDIMLTLDYSSYRRYKIQWWDIENSYKSKDSWEKWKFPEEINQILVTVYNYYQSIEYNINELETEKKDISNIASILWECTPEEILELFKEEVLYRRSGSWMGHSTHIFSNFEKIALEKKCSWLFMYFSSTNNKHWIDTQERMNSLRLFLQWKDILSDWWKNKIATRLRVIIKNKPDKIKEKFTDFLENKGLKI